MRERALKIKALNATLVTGIALVAFSMAFINLLSPGNGECIGDRKPELRWGGMQGTFTVLIDEDPGFGSPLREKVVGNRYIPEDELDFGTYYWKVESGRIESGVGKFTVSSSVVLGRDAGKVSNQGNADVLLRTVTGSMVLKTGDSIEIGEDEDVKAEQV